MSRVFHLAASFSNTPLWKEMEIVEKEESLPVFDSDGLTLFFFFFFFLPTVEITARLTGKINTNLPVVEGLIDCGKNGILEKYSFEIANTIKVVNVKINGLKLSKYQEWQGI